MTTLTASTKPSTWRDRIALSDESIRTNLVHNEVVTMFQTNNDTIVDGNIEESARKTMLDAAKDLSIDIMMFTCPVSEEMNIVHYAIKVGGTILDKDELYFSLAGM